MRLLPDALPHRLARSCLVLQHEHAPLAVPFIHRLFRAFFVQGRNISHAEVVHAVLAKAGADATAVLAAAGQPETKKGLKTAVDASIARGVFGAPFFFVDEEPFWGSDRLPQIEPWLATGAFCMCCWPVLRGQAPEPYICSIIEAVIAPL
jgi:2-hydroxychromene-2-carboxylate isomerase